MRSACWKEGARGFAAGTASMVGRLAIVAIVALGLVGSCYRPHLVDCVLACSGDVPGACPDGMTCAAGFCTRGATCTLDVAAGGRHSCAIRGGDLACWGSNAHGQLGVAGGGNRGDGASSPTRVELGDGRRATAVVTGGRHTCAVVDGGGGAALACWGDDSFGQLGGSVGPGGTVAFDNGRVVVSATAGLYHTCALLDDGTVVCWGDDRFGQRGLARGAGTSAGTDTAPDAAAGAATAAATTAPTAGVTAAATTAATKGMFAPVDLGGIPAREVSAGAYHTCALLEGGALRCWGWNDYGQLGDAARQSGDIVPGLIVPVDLGGGRRAKAVVAGAFHTCAISDEDQTICWGQNSAGQTGRPYDSAQKSVAPGAPVDLGRGRHAISLAAGASHTCAVLDDFSTKCWGFGVDGELGVSSTENLGDSEPLGDALPRVALGGDPVAKISAGAYHTCVVQAADVKCWGFGSAGRLGTGDIKNRGDTPTHAITRVLLPSPP